MAGTLIDFRPGPYTDYGAATLANLADTDAWLTVGGDGHVYEGANRFNFVMDHFIEINCGLGSDAEVAGVCKHAAAPGINCVRFLGWNNKAVADSGDVNLGCWTDPSGTGANNGAVVYGATYNEPFLIQMDKTIADLNSRGIRVWFTFDHGDKPRIVAGLPPNSANGSTSTKASNGDHGMMWSDEWMDVYEAHISYILSRASTVAPYTALKDNPMASVIQANNENSFWDACTKDLNDATYLDYTAIDYIVAEVGGTGSGPSGGSGYWRASLDTHWNAYATAQGFSWPVARFPFYSDWWAWGTATGTTTTDKERMIDYIKTVDYDAAVRLKAFIKALSPNCLYIYTEARYADIRLASVSDIGSIHVYASDGIPFGASTPTRKSCVSNVNGIEGTYWSQRVGAQPFVRTEGPGQYTYNRNDFDTECFYPTVICMQDGDGMTQFCTWQSQFYSAAAGLSGQHYTAVWPSRRLAYLFGAPIIKHRFIQPIAGTTQYVVDPANITPYVRQSGQVCMTGERANAIVTGFSSMSEWSWLKKRLYTLLDTPQDVTTDTSVNDAAVQAGLTLTLPNGTFFIRGAGAADPNIAWDFPAVAGEAITVDNFTRGPLTISGLASAMRGLVAVRSSGPWDLFQGDAVFFAFGPSFMTDTTISGSATYPGNLNAFLAGDLLTISGGTSANTRLWTPDPINVVLDTDGINLAVYGFTASGLASAVTMTLIASTFNSGAGTVSFTTDSDYPAYYLVPLASSTPPVHPQRYTGPRRHRR